MIDVKVTLEAPDAFLSKSLFRADALRESFRSFYPGVKEMAVSDLFPEGFLYKPMSWDFAHLEDNVEYAVFKRLKKSKYVEAGLLRTYGTGRDVVVALRQGELHVDDGCLKKRRLSPIRSRSVWMAYSEAPGTNRYEAGSRFDCYISLPDDVKDVRIPDGTEVNVEGVRLNVAGLQLLDHRNGAFCVLEADCPVTEGAVIAETSESVFRLRYDGKTKRMFFLPGSVFAPEDRPFGDNVDAPFTVRMN